MTASARSSTSHLYVVNLGAAFPMCAPAAATVAAASRSSPAGPSHQIGTDPVAAPPVAPRSHSRRAAPLLVAPDPAAAAAKTWGGGEGREEDWIRSGSRRRKEKEEEPPELEPPLPERPLVPAVGPRQCPFLSPIVNITGRLSPWHTRNRTFRPAAPAPGAHSLEASSGKRGLIGPRPPSLPCQHVRLRADQGLAAGGRRNRRVGRDKAEDWAEARRTRMQPRSPAALLQLPPDGSLKLLQALIEASPV
ncbi:uncharacterized protein LOC118002524 [Mirounga leonina]|uniref:uncharacterized protein LOC118002524 n=1 Tax=Mirounga leonina TaxID=9715 RepID=UPI00156C4F52|nr:uncharacterized protein LOC118002524 [Mirounga leonina]